MGTERRDQLNVTVAAVAEIARRNDQLYNLCGDMMVTLRVNINAGHICFAGEAEKKTFLGLLENWEDRWSGK